MKRTKIVLCTGWGDSGKGLVTDNLCTPKSLVVRFSGGFQCGHTVIRNDIKHVFSNFGSGTLKGCPTYFTEDTAINLSTMTNEANVLSMKGIKPELYVHPLAVVGTPWDMVANRLSENRVRHGSCGLGFGKAMKRCTETPYKLYAQDLFAPRDFLYSKVNAIFEYYANADPDFYRESKKYVDEMQMFQTILESEKPFTLADFHKDLIHRFDDFVFEGSQGILLDMDHGIFPNVTYANTTSKNAWKYAVGDVDVYYVTRCYQTRHGEGWMSNENEKDEYDDGSNVKLVNNSEEINKFNNWQRDFRIGELDCDMIKHAINVDKCYHPRHIPKTHLVVTCLDQRPDFYFPFDKFKNIVDVMHSNDSPKSDNMKTLTL